MDRPHRPSLGFIGTGVVARALSQALSEAGYAVVAIHGRDRARAGELAHALPGAEVPTTRQAVADRADLVVLAVPDDAIESVAASIRWRKDGGVVHCNGAASLAPLAAAAAAGAATGVFHPLQSFATVAQARRLMPQSTFRIEASDKALEGALREMALALGGRPFVLGADPTLYHVSAVLASNYLVALLDTASSLWAQLGVSREDGLRALLPLVRGTIENVETLGIPDALTGPIARGDVGTVVHHLRTLRALAPQVVRVYKELALRTVQTALAKGTIDAARARRLEQELGNEGGASCG